MYVQEFLQLHPMLESYLCDNYLNSIIFHHDVDASTKMDFVLKSKQKLIKKKYINKKTIKFIPDML